MRERVKRLREQSIETRPSISSERARLLTDFYQSNEGKYSLPVMRAMAFKHLCEHKTLYIGADELIVGERGPEPMATPTFPELTCHSIEDLSILNSREKTSYRVSTEVLTDYQDKVIPYWRGRSLRDRAFPLLPPEWHDAYEAGVFTELLEQRAPGHTVADGKIYRKGLVDFKKEIAEKVAGLDFINDPEAFKKKEQLTAMDIAADAAILFAERHAELAREMAEKETDPVRKSELEKIAVTCNWVPAHAPRDYWEALQTYWFYHLGVITELNGWDSFNPGHLDQHLEPFYNQGLDDGSLDRESAKELLECFWVKFNNQPAPPKMGVTAAESGTYTDFANINIGGLKRRRLRRGQRRLLPLARSHRRDAHPPAQQQHPAFQQEPGPVSRQQPPASFARDTVFRRSSTPTSWWKSSYDKERAWRMPAKAAPADASRREPSARKLSSSPATSTW